VTPPSASFEISPAAKIDIQIDPILLFKRNHLIEVV
jgi:hypothetical protein